MTAWQIVALVLVLAGLAALAAAALALVGLRRAPRRQPACARRRERILFPFVGHALSRRALDAALRLARAERRDARAGVPRAGADARCRSTSPLPRQCERGAAAARGDRAARRAARRARRRAASSAAARCATRCARLIDARALRPHRRRGRERRSDGLHGDDIAWLLDHAPGEVVIIRPDGGTPAPRDRVRELAEA